MQQALAIVVDRVGQGMDSGDEFVRAVEERPAEQTVVGFLNLTVALLQRLERLGESPEFVLTRLGTNLARMRSELEGD
ncbi:MAG: hypothetical protein CL424_11160 [Acidimicrobiaceae bacterium]|nr:hypothetical protein [Acidimicrobiaceae bacterium]